MSWDAEAIHLSVDGIPVNQTDLSGTVNRDGSGINPLRQPHYIRVYQKSGALAAVRSPHPAPLH
jgi:hypothetical protein